LKEYTASSYGVEGTGSKLILGS